MKEPVVVAHTEDRSPLVTRDEAPGWSFLFLLGAGLTVIGFIDVGLLFFAPQWASLDWEFGTISSLFQGLPVVTLGIGLMSASAVANGSVLAQRLMMTVTMLMTLVLGLLAVMFALDVPPVIKAVEPAMKRAAKLASLKTGLMALTYLVLYLALGLWTWRRLRRIKAAGG